MRLAVDKKIERSRKKMDNTGIPLAQVGPIAKGIDYALVAHPKGRAYVYPLLYQWLSQL
jgi:hypothetical protein